MMPSSRSHLSFLFAAMVLAPAAARSEPAPLNVPILLRGAIGQDACPQRGRVSVIGEATGDATEAGIAVQSGPGETFGEIGRLPEGEAVSICQRLGPWLGVVYGSAPLGCRTTILLPTEDDYTGPCQRGWVPAGNVTVGVD